MMKVSILFIRTGGWADKLFGILSSLRRVKRFRRLGCIVLLSFLKLLRLSKFDVYVTFLNRKRAEFMSYDLSHN